MASREIRIIIDKRSGEIKADASGYTGKTCSTDLNTINEILGTGTSSRRAKPEYRTAVHRGRVKIG
jgi:hypothetical protein